MAGTSHGRGRRTYAERAVPLRRPGAPALSVGEDIMDLHPLMGKICSIVDNVDPLLLNEIETNFKQLCTNKDSLITVLTNLHCKALCDHVFGEKLVILMQHIASMEIDNTIVRNEFLKFLQNDFLVRETISESDSVKFMNSVLLLGGIYQKVFIAGKPIAILGIALMDYLLLLLQGDDEHFKILAKELILNGNAMAANPELHQKFELLKHSIRQTIVNRNLSTDSKCWLLLAMDYISNDLQPLEGVLKTFYLNNLGDDYVELELESKAQNTKPGGLKKSISKNDCNNLVEHLNHLEVSESPDAEIKTEVIRSDVDSIRQKMRKQGLIPGKKHDDKKSRNWKEGEKLSDDEKIWGMKERNGHMSGHDDRFQRDDDFYGIQLPRTAKPRKIQGRGEDKAGLRKSLDANWKQAEPNTERKGEDAWD